MGEYRLSPQWDEAIAIMDTNPTGLVPSGQCPNRILLDPLFAFNSEREIQWYNANLQKMSFSLRQSDGRGGWETKVLAQSEAFFYASYDLMDHNMGS